MNVSKGKQRSPSSTPTSRAVPLPSDSATSTSTTSSASTTSSSSSSSTPSSSTPKLSSPLNPFSTPPKTNVPLPALPADTVKISASPPTLSIHQRINSHPGRDKDVPRSPRSPLSAPPQDPSSLSLPPGYDASESMRSTFRERSRSPARGDSDEKDHKLAASWWGRGSGDAEEDGEKSKHVPRPWQDPPKRQRTIPPEQTEAYETTRKKVAQAVISALGTTSDLVHEALYISVELLEFAPVPGLAQAAKTVLNIWDAAQLTDMNRLGCLRLTERCADILISVRWEVSQSGDRVGEELASPLRKLEESYLHIHRFMLKQTNRPWLKRYLKRDEILREIAGCDSLLRDALTLFNTSIQLRILHQVQESERRRLADMQAIGAMFQKGFATGALDSKLILETETEIVTTPVSGDSAKFKEPYVVSTDYSSETVTEIIGPLPPNTDTGGNALGLNISDQDLDADSGARTPTLQHPSQRSSIQPSTPLPAIQTLQSVQNSWDAALDLSDLRTLLRSALQASSDAEMVEVLGIGRPEVADAIKTMQRALERLAEVEKGREIYEKERAERLEKMDKAEKEGRDLMSEDDEPVVVGRYVTETREREGGDMVLKRSTTIVSIDSSSSSSEGSGSLSGSGVWTGGSSGGKPGPRRKDTLNAEFMEFGIDCLRRMSRGTPAEMGLPSWTITKYEVDRDDKIGIGFFSDVYRGTWRRLPVAIKVLADTTPRKLFVREMGIWKTLRHPNVLTLYGASSATGDPPWFFVSPYLKNGSLNEHLRRVAMEDREKLGGLGVPGGSVSSGGYTIPTSPYKSPAGRAISLPAVTQWKGPGNGNGEPSGSGSKSPAGGSPGSKSSKPLPPTPPTNPAQSTNEDPTHNTSTQPINREWDLFRFMHEIAKGMEYLHGKGVLHGDLKAANVLVDDKYRCVISDFGQSEMKSEAYRISGTVPTHGTLRWQSPEMMSGQSQLTPAVDVWAFSICCVEILTMGRMPWPLMPDESVRHFVLHDNTRPPIPRNSRFNIPALQELLRICWATSADQRPSFVKVAKDLKLIRKGSGLEAYESPRLPVIEDVLDENVSSPSPDLRPTNQLPDFLRGYTGPPPKDVLVGSLSSDSTFHTARGNTPSPQPPDPNAKANTESRRESTVATEETKTQQVIYTPGPSNTPSRNPSLGHDSSSGSLSGRRSSDEDHERITHEYVKIIDRDGYESPPPVDERIAQMKNERRYRLLLTHEYHPSLTLPLWDPTPVEIGAVGYLSKPRGEFITLFNAYLPVKSGHSFIQTLPSIDGYGPKRENFQRVDRRSVAQKAMDLLYGGSLTFRNFSEKVSRRYSFPLKAGHKVAYLCAEITEYRYLESLEAPKKWFHLHVDTIMQAYGRQHHIQKEDLFLVIGALRAPNYGLFVSHSHPEGNVHLSIYSNQKANSPWGTFTTDANVAEELVGPSYDSDEIAIPSLSASKVSSHGNPWAALLLARLRFKPDAVEPTSK